MSNLRINISPEIIHADPVVSQNINSKNEAQGSLLSEEQKHTEKMQELKNRRKFFY